MNIGEAIGIAPRVVMTLPSTYKITLELRGGVTVMDGARDAFRLEEATGIPVRFVHNGCTYEQQLKVTEICTGGKS